MHLQLSLSIKEMGWVGVSEFDAIFVGAGHNSLACAAHLARFSQDSFNERVARLVADAATRL